MTGHYFNANWLFTALNYEWILLHFWHHNININVTVLQKCKLIIYCINSCGYCIIKILTTHTMTALQKCKLWFIALVKTVHTLHE